MARRTNAEGAGAGVTAMIEDPIPWPDSKRCAVALTFDMDAESLLHINFRESAPGRVALASMLRYGTEIAVPRLLFRRFGLQQTFFVARLVRRNLSRHRRTHPHGWP